MTDPRPEILSPDEAIENAKVLLDVAVPPVKEALAHATHAHFRCNNDDREMGGDDEDSAPFILHRIVMEMTDGIVELMQRSCGVACVPLIRTSFEATFGLEYILQKDTTQRSLNWFCVYYIDRLRMYRMLDPSTPSGKEYEKAWGEQFGSKPRAPEDLDAAIKNLESLLRKPHLKTIVDEYEAVRKKDGRRPNWYRLFGGPSNLRELAKELGQEAMYAVFYPQWSGTTHAREIHGFLTTQSDGSAGMYGMRFPREIPDVAKHAAMLQVKATRLLIGRYRPGESIKKWYQEEYKP